MATRQEQREALREMGIEPDDDSQASRNEAVGGLDATKIYDRFNGKTKRKPAANDGE